MYVRAASAAGAKKYASYSTLGRGVRVHVFCFYGNLDLVHIGTKIGLFVQIHHPCTGNRRPESIGSRKIQANLASG
ncbi:unnamed protein product [Alopecurus aequalis]